jgi:hypothetical protein
MEVRLQMKRASGNGTIPVVTTNDPSALAVIVSEEDIRKSWPWSYQDLTMKCRERYADFKQDAKYHNLRRSYEKNPKLAKVRLLDPSNTASSRKTFYNPNIISEFDKNYQRK